MDDNIDRLKKAIGDKEAPMALAQTRLDNRSNRPNVELCRDPVQYRLVEEVGEINADVANLQARLAESESSLKVGSGYCYIQTLIAKFNLAML